MDACHGLHEPPLQKTSWGASTEPNGTLKRHCNSLSLPTRHFVPGGWNEMERDPRSLSVVSSQQNDHETRRLMTTNSANHGHPSSQDVKSAVDVRRVFRASPRRVPSSSPSVGAGRKGSCRTSSAIGAWGRAACVARPFLCGSMGPMWQSSATPSCPRRVAPRTSVSVFGQPRHGRGLWWQGHVGGRDVGFG